ncbi:MAG: hypothetical protein E6Q98_26915 [Rhodospirillaceae bacterium]|nr:MAG: hypothetical protein E6Q98_26915 [Rhodospirillaceae bacterium]
MTPRGEVVPKDDTPDDLRDLVERRSAAIRAGGLQKTWPDLSPPDIFREFAPGAVMQLGDELAVVPGEEAGGSYVPASSAGGEAMAVELRSPVESDAAPEAASEIAPAAIAFPDALGGLSGRSIGVTRPALDIAGLDAELAARLDALAAGEGAAGEGGTGDRRGFARRRAAGRYLRSPWSVDWTRAES